MEPSVPPVRPRAASRERDGAARAGRIPAAWALGAAAWLVLAAMFYASQYLHARVAGRGRGWDDVLHGTVLAFGLWALIWPWLVVLSARVPVQPPHRLRSAAVHLAAGTLVAAAHGAVFTLLAVTFLRPLPPGMPLRAVLVPEVLSLFPSGLVIYAAVVAAEHALRWQRAFRETELAAARLEARLTRARLDALRDRLHPHFLFNTLHTISALMDDDVPAARRTVAELSDLLRMALDDEGGDPETSLERELELTGLYLSIMRTRFPDRLRVQVDVDARARGARVPRLLLQPLVENAVRHGLGPSMSAGTLRIRARVEGGDLFVRVEDDGVGLPAPPPPEGEGLRNTRARVAALYGDRQSLVLEGAPGAGTAVTVTLPYAPAGGRA